MPLVSALYITFGIGQSTSHNKQLYAMYVAILSAVLTLISTICLLVQFDYTVNQYQFVERYIWLEYIGLELYLGVDGISIFFVFLTALLTLLCIIASVFTIKKFIKEFLLCFLLLEAFCIGVFTSLNLLLFYLFFEIILIPMYIIIGIWGGPERIYAALKFFLYTLLGSLLFLISLIYIYTQTYTFDIQKLTYLVPYFTIYQQKALWIATFIAFAIKVPMPPFHTWLPDAHVQAPTAGSVMLAGILLKLGGYAFLRISLPMMPDASKEFAIYVLIVSVIAIIHASFVAMVQEDMKKMIAYSSVAHMGYVTAGIFSFTAEGINGSVFQMISHGLISAALFLIVGILYERNHTKQISMYGGLAPKMPILSILFMITMLASIGIPGSSGFVGEFFSLLGLFKANKMMTIFAAFGIILSAIYMLRLYRDLMLGRITNEAVTTFKDLYLYEMIALLPLIVLIVYLGILPNNLIQIINSATTVLLRIYGS